MHYSKRVLCPVTAELIRRIRVGGACFKLLDTEFPLSPAVSSFPNVAGAIQIMAAHSFSKTSASSPGSAAHEKKKNKENIPDDAIVLVRSPSKKMEFVKQRFSLDDTVQTCTPIMQECESMKGRLRDLEERVRSLTEDMSFALNVAHQFKTEMKKTREEQSQEEADFVEFIHACAREDTEFYCETCAQRFTSQHALDHHMKDSKKH